jgi:hypothetical protein
MLQKRPVVTEPAAVVTSPLKQQKTTTVSTVQAKPAEQKAHPFFNGFPQ